MFNHQVQFHLVVSSSSLCPNVDHVIMPPQGPYIAPAQVSFEPHPHSHFASTASTVYHHRPDGIGTPQDTRETRHHNHDTTRN
jgi:hypothetical protein